MRKSIKFILIFIMYFMFVLNVDAINANSPVYEDITYSQCRDFQDSSVYTTTSGYFGHCIKATCITGTWMTEYYINNKMVVCTNGNQNKYTQMVKTGCSKYVNSCTPTAYPKYCTIIVYYDCSRTSSGAPYVPPTTTKRPTTTTRPPTTTRSTTKPATRPTTRPIIKPSTTTTTTTTAIKSGNTYIESLVIRNDSSFQFNKYITDYTIQLEEDVTSLILNITLEDEKSSYDIENNIDINRELPIKITVTAQDETTKVYTINIKDPETVLNSNSKINSLKIENYSIDFDPEIYSYSLKIKDESKLDILLITESEKSSHSITGNENLKNKSRIDIVVKAEDGSESIYIINIKKQSKITASFTNIALILIVIFIFGFAGFNIYRKIRVSNEKPSSYEYE